MSMPTPAQIAAATNSVGYVNYVNSIQLCGFNDWRVPTRLELMGIVDYSKGRNGSSTTPTVRTDWFPNTALNDYLTRTRSYSAVFDPDTLGLVIAMADDTSAWLVSFDSGEVRPGVLRLSPMALRLVRGSQ